MSKLICIDPGHGGPKPGAVGRVNGTELLEKDVVWGLDHNALGGIGMANRVGHHLRKAGYRTVMTRESDVDVDLMVRGRLAVRAKADVFVSIHCNSFGDPQANGIEAYVHTLQRNRADVLARWILEDMLRKPEFGGVRNRGVKTSARLTVLHETYAYMPAVLIELPFLSNPNEAGLLADRYWRDAAAQAIAGAIGRFLAV